MPPPKIPSKKGLLLLSSGIDSPVAGHIMLRQGIDIVALHFHNQHGEGYEDKGKSSIAASERLVARLEELSGKKIPLIVVENFSNEKLIFDNTNHRFQCLLCKRMMYRIAERIAIEQGCDFLVTGENLGQVASQTMENMAVLNQAITLPVLRPLLTYDKNQTIKIAEEIGTFQLSTKAGKCPFVPSSPLTRAAIKEVKYEESKLDIGGMVEGSLKSLKTINREVAKTAPNAVPIDPSGKSSEASFYNKVAEKFGGYKTPHTHHSVYPEGNPEEIFLIHLKKLAGKDKIAMDIGCADGRFTLSLAPSFQKIIAIDVSKGMLAAAKKFEKEQSIDNVHFELLDAEATGYPKSSFDVVYSRRGPTPYEEIKRLLVTGGHFVGIIIGEQDCKRIKEEFGRGQGYGEWNLSRKESEGWALEKLGFKIISAKEYLYAEYYPTYSDIEAFLDGVPIFNDFDKEKDRTKLEAYAKAHATEKGILLERHRIVIVAQKI